MVSGEGQWSKMCVCAFYRHAVIRNENVRTKITRHTVTVTRRQIEKKKDNASGQKIGTMFLFSPSFTNQGRLRTLISDVHPKIYTYTLSIRCAQKLV